MHGSSIYSPYVYVETLLAPACGSDIDTYNTQRSYGRE